MKKQKKNKKHKPKSRIKYEKKNPVFSVRMPLEWHKACKKLLEESKLSRREFLGLALEKITADYKKAREGGYKKGFEEGEKKGIDEGYLKGKSEWCITLPCKKCGMNLNIYANTWVHEEIRRVMKNHFYCIRCSP